MELSLISEKPNDSIPNQEKLFRIAKRLLVSVDEAKDAVQEINIKWWQMPPEKKHALQNVESYAVTMIKNYCLDRLKSREAQNLPVDESMLTIADEQGLAHRIEQRDGLDWVSKLINILPERERLIIQLREIENYEFSAIAQIVDLPETTVRVYLSRARKKLRSQYLKIDPHGI